MAGDYPEISRGIGKFTPEVFRRLMDMLKWWESNWRNIQMKEPKRRLKPGAGGDAFVVGIITSATEIDQNRWRYEWVEASFEVQAGIPRYVPKDDGLESLPAGDSPYAYNRAESHNDGTGLEGYGVNVTIPPDPDAQVEVLYRPIMEGAAVLLRQESQIRKTGTGNRTKSEPVMMFSAENAIDVQILCNPVGQ